MDAVQQLPDEQYTGFDPAGKKVVAFDWTEISKSLDAYGNALLPGLITIAECQALSSLYSIATHFRSRVVMERHGFGRGEYQYFKYPLPPLIAGLRSALS